MIVEPDFLDHWKTRLLARKLKTEAAPIYVIRLWAHCQTRKAWRFQGWDQDVLASVCRWEGDAGHFWSAMLETFCRLEDGHLVAHDWDGANASLIANWANGQRGGRPRRNPPETHGLTQAKPMANPRLTHGVTDREDREEKIDGSRENRDPDSPPTGNGERVEAPKKYTQARIVLHALNEAAGRHYRETETNLDFIRCRLEEPGVTVEGCIAMIRRQVARWKTDPKMAEFLRPETLFNRTKFDSYYANRDLPAETAGNGNGQRIGGPNLNAHVAGVADRIRERREQWEREDPDAPPPGFEREPKLALPGLGSNGNPPQG